MHELLTLSQANHLMLAILIAAPFIGLIWGVVSKRLVKGIVLGLVVGVGNFALWTMYNTITNKLGLDTVVNLEVNLALFVGIGVLAGIGVGLYKRKSKSASAEE